MGLLSAIVLLLAISGFWGLRGYQEIANAVILRATELPHARKLKDYAEELRGSNDRILDLSNDGGISDHFYYKQNAIIMETARFNVAIVSFEMMLDQDPRRLAGSATGTNEITNAINQQQSLVDVHKAFAKLENCCNRPQPKTWSTLLSLREPLEQLVAITDEHVAVVEADMKRLSHALSTHYDKWTRIACFGAAMALAMVGLLLYSFNSLVVKPFRTLLDGSRLVAGGQFDHRIDLGTGDELSELAVAMNEMTDRFQGASIKSTPGVPTWTSRFATALGK